MIKKQCSFCKEWYGITRSEKGDFLYPPYCTAECFYEDITSRGGITQATVAYPQKEVPVFRSDMEKHVADWLTDMKIPYLFEAILLKLPNGKHYLPDFYLPIENIFIEVKGLWGPGGFNKLTYASDIYDIWLIDTEVYRRYKIERGFKRI